MIINRLDDIEFRLQELHDFTWLKRYGTAFQVIDETGSGCICIGMQKEGKKYFCKIAGVNTLEADVSPEESVQILKQAVSIYRDLEHPNLIKLVETYEYEKFYVAVFEWADGEDWFGTKRLKAPEEYVKGSNIDKQTNIFTLGALIFEFFGGYSPEEIGKRYRDNQFLPCSYFDWQLNEAGYKVAVKAVSLGREGRYLTFEEFHTDWKKALCQLYT